MTDLIPDQETEPLAVADPLAGTGAVPLDSEADAGATEDARSESPEDAGAAFDTYTEVAASERDDGETETRALADEGAAPGPDDPDHETRALADPPDPARDLRADGPYADYIALSYPKDSGFVDLPARSLTVQEVWQLVVSCEKLEQVTRPNGPYRRTAYTPTLPAKTPRRS